MCEDYLKAFHKSDIISILKHDDNNKHFSLNIDFLVLYEHQPDLVVTLLNNPEKCLEDWDTATLMAQMTLLKETDQKSQIKNFVHCRIYNLPFWPAVRRSIFPNNNDAGKFLQISGTVMRITSAKLLEYQRSYVCVKCKRPLIVKAEYDRKYILKQPKNCDNPEECSGTNFVHFGELDSENCKDYQEIKIQEQVKKLGVSSMPDTIWVTLEDDLVDSCKPGDNVTICGIVKRRWGEFVVGRKIDIDLVFKANHIQVDNSNSALSVSTPEIKEMFNTFWEKYADNSLEGRDMILKSFCPQIYGLYLVKLAIAVVLAGGSHVEDESTGVRTRSEPHLLLVGDPGTGKSQLLRFASKIIPRSVLTTGVGSTAAGLTVTATMEHGEWQLEGGALVMADGGICCIDEFNSMKEHDRTCIHEAMEQQTISVAKASMVCKLNTRCSVLAACNPKGNLDPSQPLCMNIALPSPLLSRFDLILLLRDTVDQEWDDRVADYILNGGGNISKLTDDGYWSLDIMQTYFVTIKRIQPRLSKDAEVILGTYYQMQRKIDKRNKARTTVRLLESLVRLSQGHARLMHNESVQIMDSIYAIILVDAAMDWDSAILNLNVTLNSVFPERPARDYRNMLEVILNKLQLHQILEKELNLLNKSKSNNVQSRFFTRKNTVEGVTKQMDADDLIPRKSDENCEIRQPELNHEIEKVLQPSRISNWLNPNKGTATRQVIENNLSRIEDENVEKRHPAFLQDAESNIQESSKNGDSNFNYSKKITNDPKLKCTTTEKYARTNKSSLFNSELDEGYDTVSFNTSDTKSRVENNLETKIKIQHKAHCKNTNRIDIFSGNNDESDFLDILKSREPKPSKSTKIAPLDTKVSVSKTSGKLLIQNINSADSSDIAGPSSNRENKQNAAMVEKSHQQQTIRNKLKKFKFSRKTNDTVEEQRVFNKGIPPVTVSLNGVKNNGGDKPETRPVETDLLSSCLNNLSVETNQISSSKDKQVKRKHSSSLDSDGRNIKKKSSGTKKGNEDSIDPFKTDLELLEHMPGVNDNFDIDLDFDWEGLGHQTQNDTSNKTDFSNLSQNSKIKSIGMRFSSNSKIVKKLSSDSISSNSSLVKSDIATSSQSVRTIFESSEDNMDDLDFDI